MGGKALTTPAKAGLMAGAAGTPGKGGVSTPDRDKMIKLTFSVQHENMLGGTMFVVGSLPSLGATPLRSHASSLRRIGAHTGLRRAYWGANETHSKPLLSRNRHPIPPDLHMAEG